MKLDNCDIVTAILPIISSVISGLLTKERSCSYNELDNSKEFLNFLPLRSAYFEDFQTEESMSNYRYILKDLIDIESTAQMFELLYEVAQIPNAVIDMEGNVLVGAGWQSICTDFHRKNPESETICIESDTHISAEIAAGKAHCIYECPLGLVDSSCPIIIDGHHLGNVFTGQMLHTPLTDDARYRFRAQAQQYGYDEEKYMEALERVPIFPIEKHKEILKLLSTITQQLADSGLAKLINLEHTQKIVESANLQKTVFDSIDIAIHLVDENLHIQMGNEKLNAWCDQLGLNPDFIGKPLLDIFPFISEKDVQEYHQVLQDGKAITSQETTKIDGRIFTTETVKRALLVEGKIRGVVTLLTDITDRRQAEEVTNKAFGLLKTAERLAHIGSWEWDIRADKFMMSEEWLQIHGVTNRNLMMDELMSIAHPDDAKMVEESFKDALDGVRPYDLTHRIIRQDNGEERVVHAKGIVSFDKKGTANWVLGTAQDITEKVESEQILKASEEKFRAMIETSPDGTAITALDGKVQYVSPQVLAMWGYERESEMIGMSMTDLFRSDYHEKATQSIGGMFSGKFVGAEEYVMIRKDGSELFGEANANLIYNEKGEPVRILFVVRDITEHKQAEAGQKSLEKQLLQAQKLEAVGTMVGGISHELNNILQSMFLYGGLVQEALPDKKPLQANMQHLLEEGERAREIVKQVLTFSRKSKVDMKSQSLHELILETLILEQASLPANITLKQDVEISLSLVECDKTQIHQIVLNLCNNASQAMEATGGILTVSLHQIQTSLNGSDATTQVQELMVQDTGHGIDPADLDKIFDPFFTTKEFGRGTGLGLSVIHGIVEMMQGQISVVSELERGSTFRILLPVTEKLKTDDPTPHTPLSSDVFKQSILLVDDEESIREVTQAILNRKGFVVESASDGQKAFDLFKANPNKYNLIVTDLSMPIMSGIELCQAIRATGSDIPIMLSTGHLGIEDQQEYANIGITKSIQKPWTAEELIAQIQEI